MILNSAVLISVLLAAPPFMQTDDVVKYRLGLNGVYHAPPPRDCEFCALSGIPYEHGSEALDQVFDPTQTPEIRWDAVCDVSGPNQGAANLVINMEVHQNLPTGPIATDAFFPGDNDAGGALNFSWGVSVKPDAVGRIVDAIFDSGPNMSQQSYGVASPGKVEGAGAGYTFWGGKSFHIPGVGRETLPNGKPGLGVLPIFDGKINIENLADGTYYLVLRQGTGVNVLEDGVNLDNAVGDFAKRANVRQNAALKFQIKREPPPTTGGGNTGGGSSGGGGTGGDDTGDDDDDPDGDDDMDDDDGDGMDDDMTDDDDTSDDTGDDDDDSTPDPDDNDSTADPDDDTDDDDDSDDMDNSDGDTTTDPPANTNPCANGMAGPMLFAFIAFGFVQRRRRKTN